MKATSITIAITCIASASAFNPSTAGSRQSTQLNEKLFRTIQNMDLFAPNKDVNDYGSRNKKNIKQGKLSKESYVPDGLTKAQYEKQRNKDTAAVASNYKKNVAKAGKFLDYTQFYIDRGTDVKDNWYKSVTNGHRMAKTKYDFSGTVDDAPKQTGVEAKPKRKLFGKK